MKWPWRRRRTDIDSDSDDERWVVIDVESSGLDPAHDRLLAIGGVALRSGRQLTLQPGDSFEVLVQVAHDGTPPNRANILLHGIGVQAQRQGVAPAAALRDFNAWVDGAPLLAFHAGFDRAMIDAASRQALGRAPRRRWVDIAALPPLLEPAPQLHALDDWLAHFDIHCLARHQAAGDAWAAAEVLQRLWPRLRADFGVHGFAALQKLASKRRWLGH